MLERCYSQTYQEKFPAYKGCSVVEDWHNFQIFAKWFDENYVEGYHIDKDIKIDGNRVYGPDTCMFVSPKQNLEKAHAKHYEFISPEGEPVKVYNLTEFCKRTGTQQSHMSSVSIGKLKQHKGWTIKRY